MLDRAPHGVGGGGPGLVQRELRVLHGAGRTVHTTQSAAGMCIILQQLI